MNGVVIADAIPASGSCGASGINPIAVGVVGSLVLAAVAVALVRRHRKWYPKRPR